MDAYDVISRFLSTIGDLSGAIVIFLLFLLLVYCLSPMDDYATRPLTQKEREQAREQEYWERVSKAEEQTRSDDREQRRMDEQINSPWTPGS